jgi:hypothetical protein
VDLKNLSSSVLRPNELQMNVGAPILEVESDFRSLEKGVDRIKGLSLAEVPNSVFAKSG